jgi:hypothetical protein
MITLETYQAKRINFGGHDIMNNKRGFNIAGFIALVLAFVFSSVKTGPIYSHALVNNGITFESQASGDIGDAGEPAVDVVERFSITEVSNSELKLIEKTERYNEQAIHQKETYAVRVNGKITGYLFYDTYSLYNGDLYYYLKYEPAGLKSGPIDIMLPYKFDTYDIRTIEYPEELDQTKSVIKVYNGIKSDDKLLSDLDPGSVYVDSDSLNGFFSYSSIYEKDVYNIRREIYEKAENIQISSDGIKITLPAANNSFSEQWGLISREKLVDWEDKAAVDAVKVGDLSRVRKWGGDGQYYFMPYGYAPHSSNGFYRNSANHIGNRYINTAGRFFDDYAYITIDTLTRTQNSDGFWGTDPMVVGLYENYKVGAGFFDTRWDTEAALSLLRGYRKFDEPHMLKAAVEFADFYCDFALGSSYITENNGLLVYDYGFSATPGIKTHVSLNHLVNEMNFLYEMFMTTCNFKYLNVAEKILTGIEDTATSWINTETGDLHYGYYGNGEYGVKDYPTLTLNDLRYAQVLITTLYSNENPYIRELIETKEKYLIKEGIPF